ncbi:N-acetylmuramoyl-L-alanine amidase [Enterocloster sp. HCN-30185]|uniref:N-acetylmuramoyl-L-alanine amidase n=1 Tax=Enterocloster sp. HCN-30185 TaxID=3134663 RepID=UPI0030C39DEC
MEIRKEIKQINCYAGQNRPAWIVIHETDNYSKGAGALKHSEAHRNGNLSTSVHWYVDDTVAVQTLYYSDGAYAVGRQYGTPLVPGVTNTNSINIEICVNPDSDYDQARANCVELVRQIMAETGISADHVIRHYDAKRKHCPRKMLDQPQLWTDFKAALSEPVKKSGWQQEDSGWRYYLGNGQPVRNDWYWHDGKWYWFDGSGIMVHDTWYKYKDHWYYLGADGAMVTGQQTIDGKWYIMDDEGRMIVEPVTLTPDQDGALRWPGLVE